MVAYGFPSAVIAFVLGNVFGLQAAVPFGFFEERDVFASVALLLTTWTMFLPALVGAATGATACFVSDCCSRIFG